MRAMVLYSFGQKLQLEDVPDPEPTSSQILIAVEACGVCRTDLHIVEGELTQPKLPLVPELLDAEIIFAPVGSLGPVALKAVRKGGTVVCGGIHMSMIPAFEYELLRGERTLCPVANLTRQDAVEFIELARTMKVVAKTTVFPLVQANDVLDSLRSGNITGAAVLIP